MGHLIINKRRSSICTAQLSKFSSQICLLDFNYQKNGRIQYYYIWSEEWASGTTQHVNNILYRVNNSISLAMPLACFLNNKHTNKETITSTKLLIHTYIFLISTLFISILWNFVAPLLFILKVKWGNWGTQERLVKN